MKLKILLSLATVFSTQNLLNASIWVVHPNSLRQELGDEGYLEASLGNFGHINYGSSIVIYKMILILLLAWQIDLPRIE